MDLGNLGKMVEGAKKVNEAYARMEQKIDLINAKLDQVVTVLNKINTEMEKE